jgi:hypothetical protein
MTCAVGEIQEYKNIPGSRKINIKKASYCIGKDVCCDHGKQRWPLPFAYSIMIEKSALAGEGGGEGRARPSPLTISTITYKVAVYAPAERADALPLFLLYPYV